MAGLRGMLAMGALLGLVAGWLAGCGNPWTYPSYVPNLYLAMQFLNGERYYRRDLTSLSVLSPFSSFFDFFFDEPPFSSFFTDFEELFFALFA